MWNSWSNSVGACGGFLFSQIISSRLGFSNWYSFEIILSVNNFHYFLIGTKPLIVLNRLKVYTSLDANHEFVTNSIRTLGKSELVLIVAGMVEGKKI